MPPGRSQAILQARLAGRASAAELSRLIEAAERVVERNGSRPELVVLGVKWERSLTHKLTQAP